MARPTPQEIEDLRKQAAIDAAYAKSMRNTEEAPMPVRPASAPMAPKKYAKGGSVSAYRC